MFGRVAAGRWTAARFLCGPVDVSVEAPTAPESIYQDLASTLESSIADGDAVDVHACNRVLDRYARETTASPGTTAAARLLLTNHGIEPNVRSFGARTPMLCLAALSVVTNVCVGGVCVVTALLLRVARLEMDVDVVRRLDDEIAEMIGAVPLVQTAQCYAYRRLRMRPEFLKLWSTVRDDLEADTAAGADGSQFPLLLADQLLITACDLKMRDVFEVMWTGACRRQWRPPHRTRGGCSIPVGVALGRSAAADVQGVYELCGHL